MLTLVSPRLYKLLCYMDGVLFVQCEKCKPLYNSKLYRSGDILQPYDCKRCECYDHADSCVYNKTIDRYPDKHELGGGGKIN